MSLLREIRFDLVHSAAYSERDGTPAATMEGALPVELRLERLNKLNELQDSITLSINQALTGEIFEVLADDDAPKGEGLLQGRTPSDKVVIFEGKRSLLGQFVKVRITEAFRQSSSHYVESFGECVKSFMLTVIFLLTYND